MKGGLKMPKIKEEDEFEEFDDEDENDEEDAFDDEEIVAKPQPRQQLPRDNKGQFQKAIQPAQPQRVQPIQSSPQPAQPTQEPQYIPVPRVVPTETMLNEIYDSLQEIKAFLIEKLK